MNTLIELSPPQMNLLVTLIDAHIEKMSGLYDDLFETATAIKDNSTSSNIHNWEIPAFSIMKLEIETAIAVKREIEKQRTSQATSQEKSFQSMQDLNI